MKICKKNKNKIIIILIINETLKMFIKKNQKYIFESLKYA